MKRPEKKKIMEKYALHTKDTGSAQVQVAILTERINSLQEHLLKHSKDNHSRKGLLEMVGKRRKHLNYLRLHDKNSYEELIKQLKLKTSKQVKTRETVKKGPKVSKTAKTAKTSKTEKKQSKKPATKTEKPAKSAKKK